MTAAHQRKPTRQMANRLRSTLTDCQPPARPVRPIAQAAGINTPSRPSRVLVPSGIPIGNTEYLERTSGVHIAQDRAYVAKKNLAGRTGVVTSMSVTVNGISLYRLHE
jgi:hypothetical protein